MSLITITVNGFRAEIDSDDVRVKYIMSIVVNENDESLETLMQRRVVIAREIQKRKSELAELYLAENLASEAYSKLSIPHFTPTIIRGEKCIDCGKSTSWLWEYKPHCRNNDRPECFDYTRDPVPLNSESKAIMEAFLDEQENST